MSTIGYIIGCLIAIYALASLWEWALFKRISDNPITGKVSSVVAAWLTGSTLAGFGMADGGPFAWSAFLTYLIPAIPVGFLFYRRGVKIRDVGEGADELEKTFR